MRLTKIEFNGYKRLRSTKCNVDGKLIAFLGPNEAGKSSILNGLVWLLEGDELPSSERSRGMQLEPDAEVVKATFALSKEDIDSVSSIETDERPRVFTVSRTAGGKLRNSVLPKPRRPRKQFDAAFHYGRKIKEYLVNLPFNTDRTQDYRQYLELVLASLENPDTMSRKRDESDIGELVGRTVELFALSSPDSQAPAAGDPDTDFIKKNQASAIRLVEALASVQASIARDPEREMTDALWKRSPDFALFSERDRDLRTSYDLASSDVRENTPAALRNLLRIADTTAGELHSAVISNDRTRLRTLLRRANRSLDARLRPAWRQADLSVQLHIDGTTVEIFIQENNDNETVTALSERSDGLRSFIALSCFLSVRPTAYPPVLLIDEAETHLHLDAQADLVRMLETQELAEQVLYSTHSPGCLPTDLGTGLRFVEPDPTDNNTSHLRNDFWQTNAAGYSPLLFAMGASAAAFSLCRRALLCEGPSEMILLPALIRAATGLERLEYQVVPGLSVTRLTDLTANDIAGHVAYLVDGDAGGKALRAKLIKSGVPTDHILQLPNHLAVEDFVSRSAYLKTVRSLLADSGSPDLVPSIEELPDNVTIAKAVSDWLTKKGVKAPGKTAVASHLARNISPAILRNDAIQALRDLHAQVSQVLR